MTTTASFTRCWKSATRPALRPERWLRRLGLRLLLWLALLLAGVGAAQAEPTDIHSLTIETGPGGLTLSAQVRFELPAPVEDALLKGIPMVFVADARVLRERWYWYDKKVAEATRYMRLSYQPLTGRWRLQVSSDPSGRGGIALGQNFETRDEALAALQRITGWKIAGPGQVDPGAPHHVTLHFSLDLSQLPRPFQIGVVGQPEWSIDASRSLELPPLPDR